jgi:hypothetical protein
MNKYFTAIIIITPFIPPYLKGDSERESLILRGIQGGNLYVKDSPLKIRGVKGVMKERALILRENLSKN